MTIPDLIRKYKKRKLEIINPSELSTWDELGFYDGSVPEGYETVDEYIESNEEFDETEQTELNMINEFLVDLNFILEAIEEIVEPGSTHLPLYHDGMS